jgi:hypothetical protein
MAPDATTTVSAVAPMYPPQTEDQSFGLDPVGFPMVWSFFTNPTPGAANSPGRRAGPIILPTNANPPPPSSGPMTVTARVLPINDHVTGVVAYYRRMYVAEAKVVMIDNGAGGDAVAADGIWSASLPASAFVPGEMTRWRFVATDASGLETENPSYPDPLDSSRYYGTITEDPRIHSRLPVLHWFINERWRGPGPTTGARGSVYYDGEFYDNVLVHAPRPVVGGISQEELQHRFQSAQPLPLEHQRAAGGGHRSADQLGRQIQGAACPGLRGDARVGCGGAFRLHGARPAERPFFSTADFVEDADEIYLERAGLNPDGALYKVYANLLNKDAGNTANTGVEKKTAGASRTTPDLAGAHRRVGPHRPGPGRGTSTTTSISPGASTCSRPTR